MSSFSDLEVGMVSLLTKTANANTQPCGSSGSSESRSSEYKVTSKKSKHCSYNLRLVNVFVLHYENDAGNWKSVSSFVGKAKWVVVRHWDSVVLIHGRDKMGICYVDAFKTYVTETVHVKTRQILYHLKWINAPLKTIR